LYPDATYAKTVSLKIGDVLPHEEWVFKANWIDSTHVRNTLCYNLWDKVVETRRSWPKREIDNTYIGKTGAAAVDTGATGHPKGYACITYLNGDFYGIGDLMIGKKRKNYNIAKNEATQILIGFDGAVNIPALPDDGTWELKAPSKSHDETTAALNAWRAFASSSQADFAANASAHLDATNIID
ncbi:TPA: spore coat protein CotH, partial [Klebsiella pneumoniae]|nr:spore coat protein CotH [Klebsiella pneumoniae]